MQNQEETPSSFFLKNLLRGLAWFAVIITAYILVQSELEVYEEQINKVGGNLPLLLSIFTVSEIVFGILPPEIFMLIWQTKGVVSEYVTNLTILIVISYGAGVAGYFLGRYFSRARAFKGIYDKYLRPLEGSLKKYGGLLVVVGAVTPVPYSATCMLAGSVNFPLKTFLLLCITRVIRFAVYGWMVWTFPSWF
ncbi:MAG: VTT domain-containing protein [Cyclobacteriaceae bacterium]|nr:VTT domain-containing protein [Cyclobacteriaceae bacterium]